jgi:large subunit ribosomal protein L4
VDDDLLLSARNLHRVNVCSVAQLDPISLVGHERVVMTSGAVKKIEEWLQ